MSTNITVGTIMTQTYKILYSRKENHYASDLMYPVVIFDPTEHENLLDEVIVLPISRDDKSNLVKARKYSVQTLTLPDWLNHIIFEQYQEHFLKLFRTDLIDQLGEQSVKFIKHEPYKCQIVHELLKTKQFKNPFRADMNKLIRDWLNNPNPQYDSPLTPNQWKACRIRDKPYIGD